MNTKLKPVLKAVVGLAISVFFVYLFATRIDLSALKEAMFSADPIFLTAALAGLGLGYLTRIRRWQTMLAQSEGTSLGFGICSGAFMKSIALNNILPLRAGDIYRVLAFKFEAISRSEVAASVVFERILDLSTLLLLLGTAGLFLGNNLDISFVPIEVLSSLTFLILLLPIWIKVSLFLKQALTNKFELPVAMLHILGLFDTFINSIKSYLSMALFSKLTILSIFCWVFEASVYLLVGLSLGMAVDVPSMLFIASVGALSTIVPSSPGYIGTFHFIVVLAMTQLGFDAANSGAFAILVHLILWAGTTIAGLLFFMQTTKVKNIGNVTE